MCHQEKFKEAFKQLEQAYLKNKQNPAYWNQLGACELESKNYKRARLFFNIGLTLTKSGSDRAYLENNIGVSYERERNFARARDYYLQSNQTSSRKNAPEFNLAMLSLEMGHFAKAQGLLEFLYSKNPRDGDVLLALGNVNYLQGNPSKAIHYFQALPKSYLRLREATNNYALTLHAMNRSEEGLSLLNKASDSNHAKANSDAKNISDFIETAIKQKKMQDEAERLKKKSSPKNKGKTP